MNGFWPRAAIILLLGFTAAASGYSFGSQRNMETLRRCSDLVEQDTVLLEQCMDTLEIYSDRLDGCAEQQPVGMEPSPGWDIREDYAGPVTFDGPVEFNGYVVFEDDVLFKKGFELHETVEAL